MFISLEDFAEDFRHLEEKAVYLRLAGLDVHLEGRGDGTTIVVIDRAETTEYQPIVVE
jgi:hypothetical protein